MGKAAQEKVRFRWYDMTRYEVSNKVRLHPGGQSVPKFLSVHSTEQRTQKKPRKQLLGAELFLCVKHPRAPAGTGGIRLYSCTSQELCALLSLVVPVAKSALVKGREYPALHSALSSRC